MPRVAFCGAKLEHFRLSSRTCFMFFFSFLLFSNLIPEQKKLSEDQTLTPGGELLHATCF